MAARFVAKLHKLQTSSNLLLLQVDKDDPDLTEEALGSVQDSEGSHAKLHDRLYVSEVLRLKLACPMHTHNCLI